MGGQSSTTRRMSVDNDNSIQLSQEALVRLQSQLQKTKPTYDPPPSYEPSRRQNEYAREEAYWSRRVDSLKKAHNQISNTMNLEYEKAVSQANHLFQQANDEKFIGKLPPCQDEKSKVVKCYQDNPNTPLVCSLIVSAFSDCVCNNRIQAVAAST